MRGHGVSFLAMIILGLALQFLPATASGWYHGMCSGCGTVIDVEKIYYDRGNTDGAAVDGAIIGGKDREGGLIGRNVALHEGSPGERGLFIEVRMDSGGYRKLEIHGDMRIFRRDRVRVWSDRVELIP